MAAVKGGGPSDWTNHAQQEKRRHAERSRSHAGVKGEGGGVAPPKWEVCDADLWLCVQVVGGRITESGRLGAFITKVKKGSLADVVGHLRAGRQRIPTSDAFGRFSQQ